MGTSVSSTQHSKLSEDPIGSALQCLLCTFLFDYNFIVFFFFFVIFDCVVLLRIKCYSFFYYHLCQNVEKVEHSLPHKSKVINEGIVYRTGYIPKRSA